MLIDAAKLLNLFYFIYIFINLKKKAIRIFKLLLLLSNIVIKKVTYIKDIIKWNYSDYKGLKNQKIRFLRKNKDLDLERG